MKRLLPIMACLALLATPSLAQDTGDGVVQSRPGTGSGGSNPPDSDSGSRRRGGGSDQPVAPVPEPGTMALASMGLIALGAAARWRRRQ